MQNQKELFNLPDYVIVDPDLADDPRLRAGQVGLLTYAVINCDEFYVGFEDEKVRVYRAAELFMLKDADTLFKYMDQHKGSFNEYELNAMTSVAVMEIYAEDSSYQKEAFKIVLDHPDITDAFLISIEDKLQLNRGPKIGR